MEKFNGKIFNPNVFEKYLRTLPSTKENSMINSSIFANVNKYRAKMSEQAGGYFITEPIKGRIGGTAQNYDGETDIVSNSRKTFYQSKVAIGRDNAWGEDDFTEEITGTSFMAEAGEVKEYWDEVKQGLVLSILKGIFSMEGSDNFVDKHTYEVDGVLDADTCNKAAQKALGDKKRGLKVMFMHSAVSTNLEGLQLLNFLKYTDKDGIERDLTLATYNGKLVIIDDEMPAEVQEDGTTKYTTYMMGEKFFEFENVGVKVPSETARDAKGNGGHTDLISRVRYVIVPTLISYIKASQATLSPTNAELEDGKNWELVNDDGDVKEYVDSKLVPIVRIISKG